jgi:hypothetical protein
LIFFPEYAGNPYCHGNQDEAVPFFLKSDDKVPYLSFSGTGFLLY